MARAATAFVDFEGDFSKVGRSAGVQSKKLEGTFNSSFKRIASFAAGALVAVGVGRFLKSAFTEAENAQKVSKQTAAVLKSTGGIAKVSSKQIDTLATSLSNVAAVDDEVIQQGENVLLTFTGIRNEAGKGNDIFNQATTAALNLSAALGTDLQGSVIQIGKALNDPIKGVTALQRVGVSFTKQQREQIKVLVESGKTLEAQKLILKELGTEFGGAAEAAATPSERFRVAINNLKESLGTFLLPVFEKLAGFMAKTLVPALEKGLDAIKLIGAAAIIAFKVGFGGDSIRPIKGWLSVFAKLGALIRGFVDFIRGDVASAGVQLGKVFGLEEDDPRVKSMIKALGLIRKALVSVVQFIQRNWKPILVIAAAALLLLIGPVVAVVAGLAFLYLKFQVVRDIVEDVANVIRGVVEGTVGFFQSHSEDFAAFGKQFEGIGKAFVDVWNAIVPLVRGALVIIIGIIAVAVIILTALWDRFGHTILDKLRIAFNAIAQVVRGALQIIQGIIEIVTGIITLKWGRVWNGIKDVFGGVWKTMSGIVEFAINQISSVIEVGVSAIQGIWSHIWNGFHAVVAGVWGAILRTVGTAVNTVIDIINGIISAYNKIPFAPNIDEIGHVHWAELPHPRREVERTRAFHSGGIFDAPGGEGLAWLKSGEGVFTKDQMKALGTGTGTIDARVVVNGNVNGVDDLDRWADSRDRKLVAALGAGAR